MFTKKSSLYKLLSVALLSLSLFAFTGCLFINNNGGDKGTDNGNQNGTQTPTGTEPEVVTLSLNGSWTSTYSEEFIIDLTAKTFTNKYSGSTCYAGNNIQIKNVSNNSGYIYIQYTQAYNNDDVGKWYAIAFKDLTATSVSLSGAYGSASSTATLEEAKTTFTIANGYFSLYSDCTKSN